MLDLKEIEAKSQRQFDKECKKLERAGYVLDEYYSNKKLLLPEAYEKIKAVKCYNFLRNGIIIKEAYVYLLY